MSGLREIVEVMNTHCPHCNKPIDLTEFAAVVFQQILLKVAEGNRVFVAQFGSFSAKFMKGRKINSFGDKMSIKGRNVIRFRAARNAKQVVNPGLELAYDEHSEESEEDESPSRPGRVGVTGVQQAITEARPAAINPRESGPDRRTLTFDNADRKAKRKCRPSHSG